MALAFIALLQRLPPRQRAVLLLKDVVGWSSEEIAQALELTVPSVSSALHRARETVAARPRGPIADPPPEALAGLRAGLGGARPRRARRAAQGRRRLRHAPARDVAAAAATPCGPSCKRPPFSVRWARGLRATATRANGLPAIVFYAPDADGVWRLHSLQVMRFEGPQLAEVTNFVGAAYLQGFDAALRTSRPIDRAAAGLRFARL